MNSPDLSRYELIISDIDGTLVKTKSGATFRKTADDWEWLPGRLEKLQELREQGKVIHFASNQGGIAFGYFQEGDIVHEFLRMSKEIGYPPGHNIMHVCFTHPNAIVASYREESHGPNSNRRKPAPGMLLEAMQRENIAPDKTLMVGDRKEDENAALNAGCDFMWAWAFFGDDQTIEEHPF